MGYNTYIMSKELILLTGNIGAGKSTAAEILEKYGFYETHFSKLIKELALNSGFKYYQVYGSQKDKLKVNKDLGICFREFAQVIGDLLRFELPKRCPNLKLNGHSFITRTMEIQLKKHEYVVLSDGRFQDEAKFVRDNGGKIIHLIRNVEDERNSDTDSDTDNSDTDNSDSDSDNSDSDTDNTSANTPTNSSANVSVSTSVNKFDPSKHVSETELKTIKPDHIIHNNGSREQLEKSLLHIAELENMHFSPAKLKEERFRENMLDVVKLLVGALLVIFVFSIRTPTPN